MKSGTRAGNSWEDVELGSLQGPAGHADPRTTPLCDWRRHGVLRDIVETFDVALIRGDRSAQGKSYGHHVEDMILPFAEIQE